MDASMCTQGEFITVAIEKIRVVRGGRLEGSEDT